MVGLLVACLLPQLALAQGPADAVVLVIDCGPEDEAYFVTAEEYVGAGSAAWVPLDGSDRSTGWSSAAPQSIEYRVAEGLEPGPYDVRAWFAARGGRRFHFEARAGTLVFHTGNRRQPAEAKDLMQQALEIMNLLAKD